VSILQVSNYFSPADNSDWKFWKRSNSTTFASITVLQEQIVFSLLQKIILSEGGEIYEIWREPPVELYLKVYLFNVTNRDAFLEGREKLRVEEVGPYVYR